jgi:hypothetical protein
MGPTKAEKKEDQGGMQGGRRPGKARTRARARGVDLVPDHVLVRPSSFCLYSFAMERPLGPRDRSQRNTAYESIFGRPSAQHHQPQHPGAPGGPSPPPPPPFPYPQQQQPYAQSTYSPQAYSQTSLDRRTSYASTASHRQTYQPSPPPPPALQQPAQPQQQLAYRQSFYPQPPSAQHQHQHLPPHAYPGSPAQFPFRQHAYAQSHHIHPSYTASLASSYHGVLAEDPSAPANNHHPGLTPAQAYQAQVYSATSAGGTPPIHAHAYPTPAYHIPPQLGLNLDNSNGRLDIDFDESIPSESTTAVSHSPTDTDDGSELPWASQSGAFHLSVPLFQPPVSLFLPLVLPSLDVSNIRAVFSAHALSVGSRPTGRCRSSCPGPDSTLSAIRRRDFSVHARLPPIGLLHARARARIHTRIQRFSPGISCAHVGAFALLHASDSAPGVLRPE